MTAGMYDAGNDSIDRGYAKLDEDTIEFSSPGRDQEPKLNKVQDAPYESIVIEDRQKVQGMKPNAVNSNQNQTNTNFNNDIDHYLDGNMKHATFSEKTILDAKNNKKGSGHQRNPTMQQEPTNIFNKKQDD